MAEIGNKIFIYFMLNFLIGEVVVEIVVAVVAADVVDASGVVVAVV